MTGVMNDRMSQSVFNYTGCYSASGATCQFNIIKLLRKKKREDRGDTTLSTRGGVGFWGICLSAHHECLENDYKLII